MKGEYTAIIEKAPEGGYWAICPEVPGANGQGETIEETKQSLREAIRLIMKDRLEDYLHILPLFWGIIQLAFFNNSLFFL
ncbi:type II toxin-antitoxin system HicB family antitoxin [bacterium]|nr:type II toxin-antitoxin system HicB family antitoxin [bacterium]